MLPQLLLLDRVTSPVNFYFLKYSQLSYCSTLLYPTYRVSNWTVFMMILSWLLDSEGTSSVSEIVLPHCSISAKLLG
jgi:hypothetical protein